MTTNTNPEITFEKITRTFAYAKNGNAHNPSARTYWIVKADGQLIGQSATRKGVEEIAAIWLADPSMR